MIELIFGSYGKVDFASHMLRTSIRNTSSTLLRVCRPLPVLGCVLSRVALEFWPGFNKSDC